MWIAIVFIALVRPPGARGIRVGMADDVCYSHNSNVVRVVYL